MVDLKGPSGMDTMAAPGPSWMDAGSGLKGPVVFDGHG